MLTRIAVFCDKLLEAGWLAALIVTPLFFNVYSSRVFEPDKISLLRSIAILMATAWIIRRLESGIPRVSPGELVRTWSRENPFIVPTGVIVIVYIIATIFSVAPVVSLWGSYQRMQGVYTTFSYITIFLIAAASLHTRAQLDRAINTAIVVSFPISFYGILQHYKLDPLPWGGDVTVRVAANMGNSIFVAGYLIMVVPLVAARLLETLSRASAVGDARRRTIFVVTAALAIVVLALGWVLDFGLGTGTMLIVFILFAFLAFLKYLHWRDALLVATYTAILSVQLVAIFFTQSRGPWLGLGGGIFAFVVLYALARGSRRIVFGAIGLAAVVAAFLFVFNLPFSPLDPLKRVPYVGRLGEILDPKSPTAQVREFIWQGTVKLVLPHAPLWSPTTGEDPFNAIRVLVGYGPEAMYVAFNPFYPPELAHVEARNASPDRAHNETFDSLVMTGLLGFGAYILLFISIFYFGLKWLGVITTPGERNAFIVLWLAGGFLSALIFSLWRGLTFIGVALPAGMILGLFIFLVIDVVRRPRTRETALDVPRALWLSALFAALIAHFIEIHFGIAIVSTRTYFWFYAALLLIIGLNRLTDASPIPATAPEPVSMPRQPATNSLKAERIEGARSTRRKRRRAVESARTPARKESANSDVPLMPVLAWTAITALIAVTLAYEFVNNQAGVPSALEAVQRSLFFIGDTASPGIFIMLALTWIIAGLIGFGEELKETRLNWNGLGLALALFVVLSLTVSVWYILFQMRWLTQVGDMTEGFVSVLSLYYVSFFVLMGALAFCLSFDVFPREGVLLRSPANAAIAPALLLVAIGSIYFSNYTVVSADILYKSGTNLDNAGAWDRSITTYQRALTLQPGQDFYSLFLGRAFLEGARVTNDPSQRLQMLNQSEKVLLEAQKLNPLNTDHTANLARLQRVWAGLVDNPAEKALHFQKSSDYYQSAVRLSPATAYLYNEWSQTFFQSGEQDKARAVLEQSLKIDSQFAQTFLYLGEYYRTRRDPDLGSAANNYWKALGIDAAALSDADGSPMAGPMQVLARPEFLPHTVEVYRAALAANPKAVAPHLALAGLYKQNAQMDLERQELEKAVEISPSDYMIRLTLVNFYSESGQIDAAVTAMRGLMELLSPSQTRDYQRFQDFYAQLQNLQRAIQATTKSPNDVNAHRTLAGMWKARGQAQFAVPEYQTVLRLAPSDYDAQKNIALLNLQLNHPDDAQRAITAAVPLAPTNEKPIWQNLQMALDAQKAQQFDQAIKQAQAALALAADADKLSLQAYVTMLQDLKK